MGLYKPKVEPKNEAPSICWTNWVISDRITFYPTPSSKEPLFLGTKKFHCVRRFSTYNRLDKCKGCEKDLSKECFHIEKHFYTSEVLQTIIDIYKNKCLIGDGGTTIFHDTKYADKLVQAMKPKVVKVKSKLQEETEVDF